MPDEDPRRDQQHATVRRQAQTPARDAPETSPAQWATRLRRLGLPRRQVCLWRLLGFSRTDIARQLRVSDAHVQSQLTAAGRALLGAPVRRVHHRPETVVERPPADVGRGHSGSMTEEALCLTTPRSRTLGLLSGLVTAIVAVVAFQAPPSYAVVCGGLVACSLAYGQRVLGSGHFPGGLAARRRRWSEGLGLIVILGAPTGLSELGLDQTSGLLAHVLMLSVAMAAYLLGAATVVEAKHEAEVAPPPRVTPVSARRRVTT